MTLFQEQQTERTKAWYGYGTQRRQRSPTSSGSPGINGAEFSLPSSWFLPSRLGEALGVAIGTARVPKMFSVEMELSFSLLPFFPYLGEDKVIRRQLKYTARFGLPN
uniref:F-box protein AFR-like isoform X1 n=1 Tax=Rhizophora mucronata TaxID=61149 RepID=A0A2P2IVU8_RHIMU